MLNGWKEIGAYIGKSQRTAIRWATELGLPVHRMKGKTGEIVYAVPAEIDNWRRTREQIEPLELTGSEEPNTVPTTTRKKFHPWVIASALGLILSVAIVVLVMRDSVRVPTSWTVIGNALTVFDTAGQVLWERRFPFPLQESSYEPQSSSYEHPGLVQIADMEGDGELEVIFVADPHNLPEETKVYCFEHDGRERFRHAPEGVVRFGAEEYGPPFTVRYLRVSRNDVGSSIWIGASHIQWFPSVVQRLDSSGTVRDQYWSNGHLQTIKDVVVGGKRYLLVGGTTNEDRSASLAVLNYENVSGRAPALLPWYRCTSCPQVDPPMFFLFPRMELSRATDSRPFVTEVKGQPDGGLWVTVAQAPVTEPGNQQFVASVYYRFDSAWQLVDQKLGGDYLMGHKSFQVRGSIGHELGKADHAELVPVRKWNDTAFEPLFSSSSWQR